MLLFNTKQGPVVERDGSYYALSNVTWDALFNCDTLSALLNDRISTTAPMTGEAFSAAGLRAPIGTQEVWAAGVTYFRSRLARMSESAPAGGADFYARVYEAERPEIFFKATPHRVVGHGDRVALRRDSKWMVPEPELTLALTRTGKLIGYTIGNDMSCRDIEGENPLYLPQAKVFDRCAAIGPGILISDQPLPSDTPIKVSVSRAGKIVYADQTGISNMKRALEELVGYLYRDNSFPSGCLFMTGTGIVPPNDFCLASGDQISIAIPPIGELVNTVE